MKMSDDEWKAKLTPDQYAVLRQKGTETPYTGELLHNKIKGTYACSACGNELFDSTVKFDSGSGWPSFYDLTHNDAVILEEDNSIGMKRTEVTCAKCGGHLGHLFHDAPQTPTGDRYCINSVALDFNPKEDED